MLGSQVDDYGLPADLGDNPDRVVSHTDTGHALEALGVLTSGSGVRSTTQMSCQSQMCRLIGKLGLTSGKEAGRIGSVLVHRR